MTVYVGIINAAFVVMRYTEYDENDNAYKHGIAPALADVGIKPVVARDEPPEGPILGKIRDDVRGCRFVIAKVDEPNLNVYFELGYAMGMDKDVLLVSERDLVDQLPVDLNNWTCLTYQRGNYDGLREEIVRFFRERYHRSAEG